jgi:hypothetical protein
MKYLIISLLFLNANAVFASKIQQYKIITEIYINDTLIGAPQIITLNKQIAQITSTDDHGNGYKLTFIPEKIKDPTNNLLLKINFNYKNNESKNHLNTNIVLQPDSTKSIPILATFKDHKSTLSYLKIKVIAE